MSSSIASRRRSSSLTPSSVAPFWRTEQPCGIAELASARRTGRRCNPGSSRTHSRIPALRRPSRPPEADDHRCGRLRVHGEQQLSEATARGSQGVTLRTREEREADRSRGLDDRAPVREREPRGRHGLPRDRRRWPRAIRRRAPRRAPHMSPRRRPRLRISNTSAPASRKPRPSAAAASRAERTPFRLAGHSSALTLGPVLELVDHLAHAPRARPRRVLLVLHPPELRERDAPGRERDQAEPDSARDLDPLVARPYAKPVAYGTP